MEVLPLTVTVTGPDIVPIGTSVVSVLSVAVLVNAVMPLNEIRFLEGDGSKPVPEIVTAVAKPTFTVPLGGSRNVIVGAEGVGAVVNVDVTFAASVLTSRRYILYSCGESCCVY